jgi:hypothetical protein
MRPSAVICLAGLVVLVACDRPTEHGRPVTTPPPILHAHVELGEFRPLVAWPWNSPTQCLDLTGVRGEYDSAMVSMVNMAVMVHDPRTDVSHPLASVRLEFDRDRHLIYYQEHRGGIGIGDRPMTPMTGVGVSTGRGQGHWSRVGSARNFTPGVRPRQAAVRASAEAVWNHPHLGVPEVYRLAISRCGDGRPYVSTFE